MSSTCPPAWISASNMVVWNMLEWDKKTIFAIERENAWNKARYLELEAKRVPTQALYGPYLQEGVVSPPKKYDGGYDTQKLNNWINKMEIYYKKKGYPKEQ